MFVILLPIDCTSSLDGVRFDTTLVNGVDSRTSLQLRHDAPSSYLNDETAVYHSWMRKRLLVAFIQTLTTRVLCYDENHVGFSELCAAFEYEGGFHVFHPFLSIQRVELAIGCGGRLGLQSRKQKQSLHDSIVRICKHAVAAIVSWHRLQHGLEFNHRGSVSCRAPSFECSSTRFLIKILNPPERITETVPDSTFELCTRQPFWLISILSSFAILRNELIVSKAHSKDDFSSYSFTLLQRRVESDPVGPFLSVLADSPRCCSRLLHHGQIHNPSIFSSEIVSAVISHGAVAVEVATAVVPAMPQHIKYARALVSLALKVLKTMPRLASLLSLSQSGPPSVERSVFEDELQRQNLRVVSWSDAGAFGGSSVAPLLFPPCLRHITVTNRVQTVSLMIETLDGLHDPKSQRSETGEAKVAQ